MASLAPGQLRILSVLSEAGGETFFSLLCEICFGDYHDGDPLPAGDRAPIELVNEICKLIDEGLVVIEPNDASVPFRKYLTIAADEVSWVEASQEFALGADAIFARSIEVVITEYGFEQYQSMVADH